MEKLNKQQIKNKPVRQKKPINWKRVSIIFVFTIYLLVEIMSALRDATPTSGTLTLKEIYELSDKGEIESVAITDSQDSMFVKLKNGEIKDAVNPKNDTFIFDLMDRGINVSVQKKSLGDAVTTVVALIPMVLILTMFVIYLTNTLIGASTKMFTILKSENNLTTFDDIRGMGNTKKEVKFIVRQMKQWKKLGELGARPVKGVLLYGPPGTGKTMLAKAIAKESGVAFISASGSDFNEVFVGVGAARVRALWQLAFTNCPAILFIDEIDCLGKRRKGGDGASQDHNQTLNALLQRLDGLNDGNGLLVIGATNRLEDLDPALTRPGRFDRQIYVGPPATKADRDDIVEVYLENKKVTEEVTKDKVSKLLVGLTGAEIEEVLNSAVFNSLQDKREGVINLLDIDEAVMQLHTKGVRVEQTSKHDLEIAAYHEAGHTIATLYQGLDVSKVSVTPYSSGMGGVTMRDLDKQGDDKLKLKSEYEKDIIIFLAGKVAEEIIYGEHTQGCSNDIEQVTQMIYQLVTAYGFSNKTLLNQAVLIQNGLSFAITDGIIDDCNKYLEEYNDRTTKLLSEHKVELEVLAKEIIKKRTIVAPTIEYINELVKNKDKPEQDKKETKSKNPRVYKKPSKKINNMKKHKNKK